MEAAPISQAQLAKFKTAIGWKNAAGNFRLPQPLVGRTVAGCRTVGSSSSPTHTVKSAQCPDQTAPLVLQAIMAVLCVLILAAICLGPVRRRLTNPVSSSARQVKLTDNVPAKVTQLKEDLKFLELDLETLKGTSEANGREMAKVQDLVRQIKMNVLSANDGPQFWHHPELAR